MRTAAGRLVLWMVAGGIFSFALPRLAAQEVDLPQRQSAPSGQTTSQSPGARLTLEELLRLATENNPTLKQAEARIRAAQGKQKQAGFYPNPSLA